MDTLQDVFEQFEAAIEETGMEKIKTVGDAIVATSGILTDNHEPVLTAVECGFLFRDKANAMNPSWDVHVGIHYGPVVAGIVGRQSLQFDMLGHTLNTTFRICDTSEKNEILISNDAWMTVPGKLRGKSRDPGTQGKSMSNYWNAWDCVRDESSVKRRSSGLGGLIRNSKTKRTFSTMMILFYGIRFPNDFSFFDHFAAAA
ncbi:MAG: hypothetical protein CM15mP66_12080 [Pseudomonadota bacterium]|nr:MAG: hypothetical protein CM15mP66_12080 [Pseudomonadota bacterium]